MVLLSRMSNSCSSADLSLERSAPASSSVIAPPSAFSLSRSVLSSDRASSKLRLANSAEVRSRSDARFAEAKSASSMVHSDCLKRSSSRRSDNCFLPGEPAPALSPSPFTPASADDSPPTSCNALFDWNFSTVELREAIWSCSRLFWRRISSNLEVASSSDSSNFVFDVSHSTFWASTSAMAEASSASAVRRRRRSDSNEERASRRAVLASEWRASSRS
mmetsp:Transcript_23491/g.44626  ORF Transcript_23491/g.44626 Transcript_23491/m.44626 type:complete len:219 (-) Transcript_23491:1185-1841(-)